MRKVFLPTMLVALIMLAPPAVAADEASPQVADESRTEAMKKFKAEERIAGVSSAGEALWATLAQGSMVVLRRHATAEQAGDPRRRDPHNCRAERNLSEQGRRQAKRVGNAFKRRAVPVADVLASPYCRTRQTARLAFGRATPAESLTLIEGRSPEAASRITESALRAIGEHRGTGNLIMVTHRPNIEAIALETVEPGAFLVLRPKGGSDFDVLGQEGGGGEVAGRRRAEHFCCRGGSEQVRSW